MLTDKLCKNCRYCIKGWFIPVRLATCGHLKAINGEHIYPVSGEYEQQYCTSMRSLQGFCGPEGRLWEKK